MHFDEGHVDTDDKDDGQDKEEGDGESEFGISKVGRGQAVEPGAVEEKEQSGDEAQSDVAGDGIADAAIVIAFDDALQGKDQTEQAHQRPGQAECAELPRQSQAHVGQINRAIAANDERGDQNTRPNSKGDEPREQGEEQNQVENAYCRRILHDATSFDTMNTAL